MMPSMSTRVVSPTLAGRQVEIDRLRTALERAIAGSSSIVLVAGEDPYAWKGTPDIGRAYVRKPGPTVDDQRRATLGKASA